PAAVRRDDWPESAHYSLRTASTSRPSPCHPASPRAPVRSGTRALALVRAHLQCGSASRFAARLEQTRPPIARSGRLDRPPWEWAASQHVIYQFFSTVIPIVRPVLGFKIS